MQNLTISMYRLVCKKYASSFTRHDLYRLSKRARFDGYISVISENSCWVIFWLPFRYLFTFGFLDYIVLLLLICYRKIEIVGCIIHHQFFQICQFLVMCTDSIAQLNISHIFICFWPVCESISIWISGFDKV